MQRTAPPFAYDLDGMLRAFGAERSDARAAAMCA